MNSPTDTLPNTGTAPVQSVATVIGRMFGRPLPGVGEEGTVWISRPPIQAIDFYPATPTTTQGETSAL